MAINSTTNLGLALPDQGEWDGTWGTNTNQQITELIDSAVAGTTTLSADADVTLTDTDFVANQSRQAIILWTASNGATTRNITAPARSKSYVVINAGTGSIVLRGAGPTTGITIVAGERCVAAWNGSDFVKIDAAPAGAFTQVQFNNGGSLGASANLTFTNGRVLTVGSGTAPNWSFPAISTIGVSSPNTFDVGSNFYFNSGYKRISPGTNPTRYSSYANEHIFYTAASGAADSAITWTQVLKNDINNNIKIGTGEPAYKLDVGGTLGVSGDVTLTNYPAFRVPYMSGSNVLTSSDNFTYNDTTLLLKTTTTTGPKLDLTATNSGGGAVPTMRFIRTTQGGSGNQFVGLLRFEQTQTDASVVNVGSIFATSNNDPATMNGTLAIQAEREILFQSTASGQWGSLMAGGLTIGSTAEATARIDVVGDKIRVRTAKTPASSSDTGNAGDICWDSNYVYVCVATDTWKRSALSTW